MYCIYEYEILSMSINCANIIKTITKVPVICFQWCFIPCFNSYKSFHTYMYHCRIQERTKALSLWCLLKAPPPPCWNPQLLYLCTSPLRDYVNISSLTRSILKMCSQEVQSVMQLYICSLNHHNTTKCIFIWNLFP